ncbi:MAG: glutamine--fructose-6-phosphate transaminase (isomerizing) [Armatimonadetes bacterium]|nr:glutamine--fructose-6-phosphate transaminase (isomerizing) [Candidatus Hippobium faecium]
MCGIIGYAGKKPAATILLDGLKSLEYRGYDSSGVAVCNGNRFDIHKSTGKLKALSDLLNNQSLQGTVGIGHTRWATHGKPSKENAHPHTGCDSKITIVHNGIIENYLPLKEKLLSEGHIFKSETDSEVIAHLIESFSKNNSFEKSVLETCKLLSGSYALVAVCEWEPEKIVVARLNSPLVIGIGEEENFIASDVSAFLQHTRNVIYLEDRNIGVITKNSVKLYDFEFNHIDLKVNKVDWTADMAEKGGYSTFMLKEIHEEPHALENTLRGRLNNDEICLEGLNLSDEYINKIEKIRIIGCGTAYHAGIVGKYLFEELCRVPVEVDFASELRYKNPIFEKNTLSIAISQSGETLDTIVGLREAKERGSKMIAITNVVGSLLAREADGVLYTYAGPEIAVASTKAYTTQIMVLNLLALYFAKIKKSVSEERFKKLLGEIKELPKKAEAIIKDNNIQDIAGRYYCFKGLLVLSRGINYANSLEGALKIKEISYMHAEGYAAGEMKHGPIAMIDPTFVTVSINVFSNTYDKMLGNLREIRARNGEIISICNQDDEVIKEYADKLIRIPKCDELLSPVLVAIPLQLLAYYIALNKGSSIDQPRNLAKTVTVE